VLSGSGEVLTAVEDLSDPKKGGMLYGGRD
jgi:hypothetical protein